MKRNKKNDAHTWVGPGVGALNYEVQLRVRDIFHSILREYLTHDIDLHDFVLTDEQRKYARMPIGEHYRLLNAIVRMLSLSKSPILVVEIGTYTGMSATTMLRANKNVEIFTFDIVPWNAIENSVLTPHDFETGRLQQIISDLSDDKEWLKYVDILERADFIFIDGPKDGFFELKIVRKLLELEYKNEILILLDDIYFKSMRDFWDSIESPRIDLSNVGHASGSGLLFPTLEDSN
jgi:predicted O-methyltransferase YrrM